MQRSGSTPSKKLDYKRELKELYGPRAGAPVIIDVPELSFLMVGGIGDPNVSQDYVQAVEALFAVVIADAGHRSRGKHHEIYLSDPSRVDPAVLRTIIRQPIASPP